MDIPQFLRAFRANVLRCFKDRWLRQILCWCLPALIVGVLLRGTLLVRMPNAFYHPDSYTVFETSRALVADGSFHIHPKKTALTPLLYIIPHAAHIPVLPAIALVQHALGLLLIVFVGLLVAHSFHWWRLFIVPATTLVAVDPAILWYEHMCVPELLYILLVTAIALTGLLFYKQPGKITIVAFLICLFLTAAARPEGKLWCLFGVALFAGVYWQDKKRMTIAVGCMLLFTSLCFVLNRTSQSGSLFYSNVAHLTPGRLSVAPGFVESNKDYFDDLRERWKVVPTRIPRERRTLMKRVLTYLADQGHTTAPTSRQADKLCARMAAETCLRSLPSLPSLAVMKFRYGLNEPTAEDFGAHWVYRKQFAAFVGRAEDTDEFIEENSSADAFTKLVFGREFDSHGEVSEYLHQAYQPFDPDWLTQYSAWFQRVILAARLPDSRLTSTDLIPGLPLLLAAAAFGLLAQALRERRGANYYYLWLGALLVMVFILALTGSNKGRFRIVLEPFCFLYALALLDVAMAWVASFFRRREASRVGDLACLQNSG